MGSAPSFEFEPDPAPVDDEGFVEAFDLDQADDINAFFERYGFVVIKDVMPDHEIEACYDEIWDEVEHMRDSIDRNDPSTWDPFVGNVKLGLTINGIGYGPAVWAARQSPDVFRAFSTVFHGHEDLLVSVDRYNLMRPTKDVVFGEGDVRDMEEWRTEGSWFHFDTNPFIWADPEWTVDDEYYKNSFGMWKWCDSMGSWGAFITENNERNKFHFGEFEKVQGLVALRDSRENDGGFQLVPGFHRVFEAWAKAVGKYTDAHFVPIPKGNKEIPSHAQRITMRRGSVVIWSSRMPHCNFPNESPNPRACVYVKMFPREAIHDNPEFRHYRALAVKNIIPQGVEITALGERLFGFDMIQPPHGDDGDDGDDGDADGDSPDADGDQ